MGRIHVITDNHSVSRQARTYAEYRVFAVVARHTPNVRRVRVVLHGTEDSCTCVGMTCAVTVALEPSGSVRIRATGAHTYAAINRAVERLGVAMGRRLGRRLSSEDR
jgi:ribosome-associated translation inhibitor RaiA